jgi:hypothetical protein
VIKINFSAFSIVPGVGKGFALRRLGSSRCTKENCYTRFVPISNLSEHERMPDNDL